MSFSSGGVRARKCSVVSKDEKFDVSKVVLFGLSRSVVPPV